MIKCLKLSLMFLCFMTPIYAMAEYEANLAWFTNANIPNSAPALQPVGNQLSVAAGTYGKGVELSSECAIDVPLLNQNTGIISFWIKPNWSGTDKSNRTILRIGDPSNNGLIINKTAYNTLRFAMTGKKGNEIKTTVVRANISGWQTGDWHHVQVSWFSNEDRTPKGLAIWIDKVCVNSEIFGGTSFMDPSAMKDNKLYIGSTNADAVMDELVVRRSFKAQNIYGATPICYRDYFLTAPYESIRINSKPNRVNSDPWVLVGKQKQFGLTAKRLVNVHTENGKAVKTYTTDYLTNFDVRYGQWTEFDAKPFITWSTNDSAKATVDANGLVTGVSVTKSPVKVSASFRNMSTANNPFSLEVRDWDNKPDLDLLYVERFPKYTHDGTEMWAYKGDPNNPTSMSPLKKWPAPGDKVTSVVHVGNFGTAAAKNYTVRLEMTTDTNNNFKIDADEAHNWTVIKEWTNQSLAEGAETSFAWSWKWPKKNALTTGSVFVRATVDPENQISEICEANNIRCEKSNARPFTWGYQPKEFAANYDNKVVNYIGSFSNYDWYDAQTDRMGQLMTETVYPGICPDGIKDSIRVDSYALCERNEIPAENQPWGVQAKYYDGRFEWMEPGNDGDCPMVFDVAIGHEIGHNALWLPDIYGQGYDMNNVFIKDSAGKLSAGSLEFPTIDGINGPWSSATYDYPDACGMGYIPLMTCAHMWLDRQCAGITNYYRQARGWQNDPFGNMVPRALPNGPSVNSIKLYDVNDAPLENAEVYLYQIEPIEGLGDAGAPPSNRVCPENPKFAGTTGTNGVFVIPTTTAKTWDDWRTDRVEGSTTCLSPFDRSGSNPYGIWGPSWAVGEMIIVKIVSNGKVEFHTLPLAELNDAFFASGGNSTVPAVYAIRTSLESASVEPKISLPDIPTENLRPVVKINGHDYPGHKVSEDVKDYNVDVEYTANTAITLDAAGSYDPEGKPVVVRWYLPRREVNGETVGAQWIYKPQISTTAPAPGVTDEYGCWAFDGTRYSVVVHLRIKGK